MILPMLIPKPLPAPRYPIRAPHRTIWPSLPPLTALTAALLLACAGCSGGDPAGDGGLGDAGPGCTADSQPGTACVPVFDRCKDDRLPLLGGGCKRVGVEVCDCGLRAPPDWTCREVGAPASCPSGFVRGAAGGASRRSPPPPAPRRRSR